MSAVNTTPETATVIFSLPFAVQQSVTGGADTTYITSCNATRVKLPVWFKYTAKLGETVIGCTFTSSNYDLEYDPFLSVWVGTPPVLTQLAPDLCFGDAEPGSISFNVVPGEDYYLQVLDRTNIPAEAELILQVLPAPSGATPKNTLLIPNDTPYFPTAFISPSNGAILSLKGLPACECGDTLPNGVGAIAAEGVGSFISAFQIYDKTFSNILASNLDIVGPLQNAVSPVRGNHSDKFYVSCVVSGSRTQIYTLDIDGIVGGTSWTLPITGDNCSALCVSLDETILYYSSTAVAGAQIHRYDLINNAPLSDLSGSLGASSGAGRDLYTLLNDQILYIARTDTNESSWNIYRYDPDGTLLYTYHLTFSVSSSPRLALGEDELSDFWVMYFPDSDTSRFDKLDTFSGVVLKTFDVVQKYADSVPPIFGVSQSCPLMLLRALSSGCGELPNGLSSASSGCYSNI